MLGVLFLAVVAPSVAGWGILPEPVPSATASQLQWVDAEQLYVGGRAFNSSGYARLPTEAQADVPPAVWQASRASSGLFVQFATNAASLHLNYTLSSPTTTASAGIPPNGYSGCDLYRLDPVYNDWSWVATTFLGLSNKPTSSLVVLESPLFTPLAGWPVGALPAYATLNETYTYRLHLPTFNGATSVKIGVPSGATIAGNSGWYPAAPLTFYGTGVTQGAVTGRPGQAYVSTVGRYINLPVHNFGFDMACQMDEGVGKWLGQVETSVYVIDCGWNMPPALIAERTAPFLQQLRAAQPEAAIVLLEPTAFRPAWILGDIYNITGRQAELRAAYDMLVDSGFKQLFYVTGAFLLGDAVEDPTLDGEFPLDYGHKLIAERLADVLAPVAARRTVPNGVYDVRGHRLEANVIGRRSAPADAPEDQPRQQEEHDSFGAQSESQAEASRQQRAQNDSIVYTDAFQLTIRGRAFNDTPSPYNRLPAAAKDAVRPPVWSLSLNSAGLTVAFRTDSPSIFVNYVSSGGFWPMVHFAVTGVSGLDLFALDESASPAVYRFVTTAPLELDRYAYTGPLVENLTSIGQPRSFLLYLPPYNTPVTLQVGVVSGSVLLPDEPFPEHKPPIVWYGTSILQGGVTFKPANIFTNVVSRALSREIFNFGFSGNGEMEISVAQYLTTIPDPAVIIVDCMWNMDAAMVANNTQPLVRFFRQAHPTTPIVLAEGDPFGRNWASPDSAALQATENAALRAAYEALVAAGDTNLYYVFSNQLFTGENVFDTPTNCGLHPTDNGMQDVARWWTFFLPTIMAS